MLPHWSNITKFKTVRVDSQRDICIALRQHRTRTNYAAATPTAMAKRVAKRWQALIDELESRAQAPSGSAPGLDEMRWSLLLDLDTHTVLPRATWKVLITEQQVGTKQSRHSLKQIANASLFVLPPNCCLQYRRTFCDRCNCISVPNRMCVLVAASAGSFQAAEGLPTRRGGAGAPMGQ